MFCRHCHAGLTEDLAICPRCGEPVSPPNRSDVSSLSHPAESAGLPPSSSVEAPPDSFDDPALQLSPDLPMRPLLLEWLFGPGSRSTMPLTYANRLQRRLLRRLPPPLVGSVFFGSFIGSLIAVLTALLLTLLVSLVVGPILDQAFNASFAASVGRQATALPATFYTNSLQLFAAASHTTVNEQVIITGSPLVTTASVDAPVSLLLVLPALGLLLGGYVAGSTNISGQHRYSITRGASISLLYALFTLVLSLKTSSTLVITGLAGTSGSITLTPDAFSSSLSGLLWGLLFGAAGGALSARSLPKTPHTLPASPALARFRAALLGGGAAMATLFALCLVVILGLGFFPQAGAQLPPLEGSLTLGTTRVPCSQYLTAQQQPLTAQGPSAPAQIAAGGVNHTVLLLIGSPAPALLLLEASMGVPLELSGSAPRTSLAQSIGLLGGDCAPGADGALFYLLLLLPAMAFLVGGWVSGRAARDRTILGAAGTGLVLALVMAVLLDLVLFLATGTITIKVFGFSVTASFGPSPIGAFLAGLVFGTTFGVLGSVLGRLRHRPQPKPVLAGAGVPLPGTLPEG